MCESRQFREVEATAEEPATSSSVVSSSTAIVNDIQVVEWRAHYDPTYVLSTRLRCYGGAAHRNLRRMLSERHPAAISHRSNSDAK